MNAPKLRRRAGNENSRVMQRFRIRRRPRLYLANYKKNNKIKKQILKCLPNLWETLIEVQSFYSICLKIGVKVKRSTL